MVSSRYKKESPSYFESTKQQLKLINEKTKATMNLGLAIQEKSKWEVMVSRKETNLETMFSTM